MSRYRLAITTGLVLALGDVALGAVTWPTSGQWAALKSSGSNMTDDAGPTPANTDVRGDSTYSSSFWFAGNDHLFFRIRVDQKPSGTTQAVWQVLLNTDADTGIDWVLQLDAKNDDIAELSKTTTEGPLIANVVVSGTATWSGAKATYSRFEDAGDGSSFGGDADGFVDVAVPWTTFSSATGLGVGDAFSVGIATSTTHTAIIKDFPFALSSSSSVAAAFGDSISVPASVTPEPGTFLLFGAGLGGLGYGAWRKRRSRRA